MPSSSDRTVPTLIIPGWQGSGPAHWQTWLEQQLHADGRRTLRPAFADLDNPDLEQWRLALRTALGDLPEDGFDVVAHSLGAVLWLHHVTDPGDAPRAARVLLVSPPSPTTTIAEVAAFFPAPLDGDAIRRAAGGTVMVAGDDDRYLLEGIEAPYARPLGLAASVVPASGHLSDDSGYGPWPAVHDWCRRDSVEFG